MKKKSRVLMKCCFTLSLSICFICTGCKEKDVPVKNSDTALLEFGETRFAGKWIRGGESQPLKTIVFFGDGLREVEIPNEISFEYDGEFTLKSNLPYVSNLWLRNDTATSVPYQIYIENKSLVLTVLADEKNIVYKEVGRFRRLKK